MENEICFPLGQPGVFFTVLQVYIDQETKQECAHVHLSCRNCTVSFCARQIPGHQGFSLSLPPALDSQGNFSSLQQQRCISVSTGAQWESLERELSQCGHGMHYWVPVTRESLGMAMWCPGRILNFGDRSAWKRVSITVEHNCSPWNFKQVVWPVWSLILLPALPSCWIGHRGGCIKACIAAISPQITQR